MPTRTTRKTIRFRRPFSLKGEIKLFRAGDYQVITEEERIEEVSFPAYRRTSTVILVPGGPYGSSIEMISVDPADLDAAQERDAGGRGPIGDP
jgi:hypothetical protein